MPLPVDDEAPPVSPGNPAVAPVIVPVDATLSDGIRIVDVPAPAVVTAPVRIAIPPSSSDQFGQLLGSSLPMRELYSVLERVAASEVGVLIEGSTGTGKELCAEAIHAASPRANGPFVVCDLAGVARTLIEAELFGHVRGAFTGADRDRDGAFVQASGGTIFIDEIGEMDLEIQPRLLRALERLQIKPVGSSVWRAVDVRVVAATNRDLAAEVRAGRFREDLFHRLAIVRVRLPALRERKEDIPQLVSWFLARTTTSSSSAPTPEVTPEAMALLLNHDWPGNVRELRNVIDRALSLLPRPPALRPEPLVLEGEAPVPAAPPPTPAPVRLTPELLGLTDATTAGLAPVAGAEPASGAVIAGRFHDIKERVVATWERSYLTALLQRSGGNVSRAAREAGLDRVYLHRLLKKHGLVARTKDAAAS